MKSRSVLFTLLVTGILVLAACGGAAATEAPAIADQFANEPVMPSAFKAGEGEVVPQSDVLLAPAPNVAYELPNQSGDLTVIERSNQMIIKNADIRLLVKDTNVAIDRTTQIVGDTGGYIISSRVWVQDYYEYKLKYATVTLGVPVDEFERVLSRLRGLAIEVRDETTSGDDVTNQYVDLQSQLTNLEATRDRIKSFLEDAKTTEEALRINQELSNIEAQIEQIKGQMNYLSDRSSFSTITINFEPEYPNVPEPEPVAWNPLEAFDDALKVLTTAYQGIAEFVIWLGVVVLPILFPPALILWGAWKMFTRKTNKPVSGN